MQCPNCGAQTPDEAWNCVSCRINVYWASQHYRDLAALRQAQGLDAPEQTPPFLLRAHEREMSERAERGGNVEHKVRLIARRAMCGEQRGRGGPARDAGGPATRAESRARNPETGSS